MIAKILATVKEIYQNYITVSILDPAENIKVDDIIEICYDNKREKRTINQNSYWHKCLRYALKWYRNLDPVGTVESLDEAIKFLYEPMLIVGDNGEEFRIPFRSSKADTYEFSKFIEFGKMKLSEFCGVDWESFDAKYESISDNKWKEK